MRTKVRRSVLPVALAAGLAVLCVAAPTAGAKSGAGPQIAKCGKFKKQGKAGRFKSCKAENKANRIAFNQIKNSHFIGVRGDGEEIEDIYCADGKFEDRSTSSSYGTGVSTGRWWTVKDAKVKQGGKWVNAFLSGTEGFEIVLLRRGKQWKYAIASLGRIREPGDVVKTDATKDCRTLEV